MMLVSALKVFADILFYMTFAGTVGAILGGSRLFVTLPFFAVALFLSSWLSKRGALRYAPMVLLAGMFFVIPLHPANIIVLVPACAYAVYALPRPGFNVREYDYIRIFRVFIFSFIPFFIILFAVRQRNALAAAAFPIGLVFLPAAILLMRMLRHDDAVLSEKKFILRNLLSVAGILVLGFAIGSQTFFNFLKAMLAFLYTKIFAPILMYGVMGILYAFIWIVGLFTNKEIGPLENKLPDFDMNFDLGFSEGYDDTKIGNGGRIFEYVLYILAAAVIVFVVIRIFKSLTRKSVAEDKNPDYIETRGSVTVLPKPPKKDRNSATGRVRELYRKFLLFCQERGMGLEPHTTSRDVERVSTWMFGKPGESQRLRELYIKVRYAGEKPNPDEIKEAKALVDALKKDAEQK